MASHSRSHGIPGPAGVPVAAPPLRRARPAPRLLRVERPRGAAGRVLEQEVRALPARLLAGLPVPVTVLLAVAGHEGLVAIASTATRASEERRSGGTVLDPLEWAALVTAAESDRLWPSDLRALLHRRALEPGRPIDLDEALDGARADGPLGWTIGRVLDRIGAQLVAVE